MRPSRGHPDTLSPTGSLSPPEEGWPVLADDEIEAAVAVLRSGRINYWTGDENRLFEEEFAAYCGARFGVALANGTLALELALHALGLEPGDEVIVPPRSFFATAAAVVRLGGVPVFVDVDRNTQNLDPGQVLDALSPRTRAVLCVHLAGHPSDLDSLLAFCRDKDLWLIEDCAQAHGARYRDRPVGAIGHIGCFSFCQDKIMTTGGEGGMLLTNDETLWRRAWGFKDHGKSYEAVFEREHAPGFRWQHEGFGSNFRLTEAQAAIGRVQLRKLDTWVEVRRRNASILRESLADLSLLRLPTEAEYARHAYYKFDCFVRPERFAEGWDRERLVQAIQDLGIPCLFGACPEIYREKAFRDLKQDEHPRLPVARELGETSLLLEVHPTLSVDTMQRRAAAIRSTVEQATG